jgi:hypothetical protein
LFNRAACGCSFDFLCGSLAKVHSAPVDGLHFDAHDATLLYVSTGGRSLVVAKLDQ